jgi:hypothetical protein
MVHPASSERHSFPAHRRTALPNPSLERNRSTAGCPPAPAMGLTAAPAGHCLLPGDWEPALLNHRTSPI